MISKRQSRAHDGSTGAPTARVLQRVVFPVDPDPEITPLYYEGELVRRKGLASFAQPCPDGTVLSRRSIVARPDRVVSTGTYFNMLPASYWMRWTKIRRARLVTVVDGTGAIEIHCSDAKGNNSLVTRRDFAGAERQRIAIDVSLANFFDGGSYWFDLVGPKGTNDVATLIEAWWEADSDRSQGTVSIGVTTYNNPADVVLLLQQVASEPELLEILDTIYVIDQGTKHCQDEPDFDSVREVLGDHLQLISQANLGGSGGISRGMYESLKAGISTYHLISDDDVRIEPESIIRAVTFADHATTPMMIGGHMFSLTQRAHLHSWGEKVDMTDFWWRPVLDMPYGANLDSLPLRVDPNLNRRINVDYNGWWMELVPITVIEKLGLSLPFFIKWDDAEYGLRGKAAGVPTVTLPGVACWHMPWVEKTDATDWQAYYHARNRIVAALLHSPKRHGGKVLKATLDGTINHLFAQQYSTARFRNDALEAILSGPDHLWPELATKRADIQQESRNYTDAVIHKNFAELPEVARGSRPRLPLTRRKWQTPLGRALGRAIRIADELIPVNPRAAKRPEAILSLRETGPRKMLHYDSVIVEIHGESGFTMYVRDTHQFIQELRRAYGLHRSILRNWGKLARQYQHQVKAEASSQSWQGFFAG